MSTKTKLSTTSPETKEKPGFVLSLVLKKSWVLYKKQWFPYLGAMLFPFLISLVYMFSAHTFTGTLKVVMFIGELILQLVLGMGLIRITLDVSRGQSVRSQAFLLDDNVHVHRIHHHRQKSRTA